MKQTSDLMEFVACTELITKERRGGKKNNISNWSGKQDDVPIDIQPQ